MMWRMSVLVVLLAGASGCSGLLQHDAPSAQIYVLRPAATPNTRVSAAGAPTLRVGRTQSAPGLDSDRIVLIRSDHRMDYFAASRWPAPLPEVVEALAVETLRNGGAWSAVHDSRGAFPTDYFLQIDIRRFEADYTEDAVPKVYVSLGCTLGRRVEQEVVKSFVAEGSAKAATNRLGAVIEAFESAARSAMAVLAEYDAAAAQKVDSPVPSMNR
jgi:cholesterol transport system auxiliary component